MPTLKQGSRKKRPNQLSGTSRFPSRQATVLAYMLTGQSPRQATFQSNQAGLQIIFLDTYRYSETNLPPHTCRPHVGMDRAYKLKACMYC